MKYVILTMLVCTVGIVVLLQIRLDDVQQKCEVKGAVAVRVVPEGHVCVSKEVLK